MGDTLKSMFAWPTPSGMRVARCLLAASVLSLCSGACSSDSKDDVVAPTPADQIICASAAQVRQYWDTDPIPAREGLELIQQQAPEIAADVQLQLDTLPTDTSQATPPSFGPNLLAAGEAQRRIDAYIVDLCGGPIWDLQ